MAAMGGAAGMASRENGARGVAAWRRRVETAALIRKTSGAYRRIVALAKAGDWRKSVKIGKREEKR